MPPDDLDVDGDNPNEMDDEMFSLLCDRIRTRGWVGNAVVTDTDGVIADGEHRWLAAKELGLDELPVKQYDLSDEERRLWRQELNKIHGEHDPERDALEFDLLNAAADDATHEEMLDLLEVDDTSLDEYLSMVRLSPSPTTPDVEYADDHNVEFCDARDGLADLADESVDCVVADPPYGIDFQSNYRPDGEQFDHLDNDGFLEAMDLFADVATELYRVLPEGGHCYVFCRWDVEDAFRDRLENAGLTICNQLIWKKNNWSMGDLQANYANQHENIIYAAKGQPHQLYGARPRTVLDHGRDPTTQYEHPTQKPTNLIEDLVTNSTRPGERVLDPFMGSGTTAVAAINTDREYVGFEADDEYRPVIERRINDARRARESTVNAGYDPAGTGTEPELE